MIISLLFELVIIYFIEEWLEAILEWCLDGWNKYFIEGSMDVFIYWIVKVDMDGRMDGYIIQFIS